MFCAAYNQDKSISTFIGRPIRISKRQTDVSLPLDLADDQVTGDKATLEAAIQALDANGWNTQGRWLRASWIVRFSGLDSLLYTDVTAAPTSHIISISRRDTRILSHQDRR
jgi:hypothetical protein